MLKVLAVLPSYFPSTVINVTTPLSYLHQQGAIEFTHSLESAVTPGEIAASDVIIASRNLEPTFTPVFQLAIELRIPIIYDLDDNLFEVPRQDVFSSYYHDPGRQAAFVWMLRHANRIRVHSPVLGEVVSPYNASVNRVWAAIDWSLAPETLPALRTAPIEIVYATSRLKNDILFQQLHDDLAQVLERFSEQVRLNILGLDPGDLKRFPNVTHHPFRDDYAQFFREFTRYGYAIGLAPMQTDRFHQCKTDTKYRDYAAAGAAGIYTDCPLYRAGVTHLETGLLVSGEPGSWADAIAQLVENPPLVEYIRRNARQFVQQRNNMQTVSQMWLSDLQAMPKRPPTPAGWTPPHWQFTRSPNARRERYRRLYRQSVPVEWRMRFLSWRTRLRAALRR